VTLVMKFGGTSVGGAAEMRQVASLVEEALPRAPLVVLSAMAGATNALFEAARVAQRGESAASSRIQRKLVSQHHECARELFEGRMPDELAQELRVLFDELRVLLRGVFFLRELTPRTMDAVASLGERLSTRLFAAYGAWRGLPLAWADARDFLRTDQHFGAARPQPEAIARLAREGLAPRLGPGRAVVTQGYVGASEDGLTTTLGRGGSDFSAALFGAALGAEEVQIWTDVEGVMTCDPRVVPSARPIPSIGFAEAAELAAFGAKVLHPATIQPAVEADVPVTVRHTQKPRGAFTTIQREPAPGNRGRAVTALARRGPVTVMTVTTARMFGQSGFLGRLFEVFGRLGVSVDLVATAEVSVSLTVEADAPLAELTREIERFARVEVAEQRSIVAIIGNGFRDRPGLARRVFDALGDVNVEMISMGANEINLSLVVRHADSERALRALHKGFFEEGAA
jgi:aspartate kinase